MACALCHTRREKRHCPGVQGDICAICCGEQREETIDCPLDCEYLRIAHEHESLGDKNPEDAPNFDHPVPAGFLEDNVAQIMSFEHAIVKAAIELNAIDFDVKEALDHLVRTYQTLSSGLYYESRPQNPIAAAILDALQERVAEVRKIEAERGMHKLRDSQVLTILIFLQQLEFAMNNGRKRGRAFISDLLSTIADTAEELQPDPGSLIIS